MNERGMTKNSNVEIDATSSSISTTEIEYITDIHHEKIQSVVFRERQAK